MTEQEQRLNELMGRDRNERIGSLRNEILDSIHNEGDPYNLAEAFKDMGPRERALGKLFGKLMQAKGNAQVDSCIAWFETEYADDPAFAGALPMNSMTKINVLASVLQQIFGADENGYRTLRQVLVRVNQK